MLSKLITKESILKNYLQYYIKRCASANLQAGRSKAAKQLVMPASEQGFFNYERYISRDKNCPNPQVQGDTPYRLMFRRLGHAYEIYPLLFLCSAWFVCFIVITWWSFQKMEVWVDRSQKTAPWSWDKIRNNYWKSKKIFFDPEGIMEKRLEIMEVLQDEMLEAAKKKGLK
uniref:Uncharacterized protein n=1 Tax=Strongyloides papillosus TaxID=174720 RepID=A0A0N5B411_STREA